MIMRLAAAFVLLLFFIYPNRCKSSHTNLLSFKSVKAGSAAPDARDLVIFIQREIHTVAPVVHRHHVVFPQDAVGL